MTLAPFTRRSPRLPLGLFFASVLVGSAAAQTSVETKVQTTVETKVIVNTAPTGGQGTIDTSFDEVPFNAVGNARSEKEAAVEAYYTGLERALRSLAGTQAEAEIGKKFRDDMERDFETFRKRYFTSDTAHVCRGLDQEGKPIADKDKGKKPVVRFSCRADGTIRMSALKNDFNRIMRSTERSLSNRLTFVVGAAEAKDPRAPYVADKLTAAFLGSGFRVLSGSAGEEQLAADIGEKDPSKKKVDFSLAVSAIEYGQFQYDAAEQRLAGSVTVRFKLFDLKGGTQVAAVPVSITQNVRGPNGDPLRNELQEKLANAAAIEIGRKTSAAVVDFQVARDADSAAAERAVTGERQYVVRVIGVTQRDRQKLRDIREAIKKAVPTATPEVNVGESNDTRTTIVFAGPPKLDTEEVLDRLFDAHKDVKSFDAKFAGNNEFTISF